MIRRALLTLSLPLLAAAALAATMTLRVAPPLDARERARIAAMGARLRPLDLICAPGDRAGAWIAALAGRATTAPLVPGLPAASGRCAVTIGPSDVWTSSGNR